MRSFRGVEGAKDDAQVTAKVFITRLLSITLELRRTFLKCICDLERLLYGNWSGLPEDGSGIRCLSSFGSFLRRLPTINTCEVISTLPCMFIYQEFGERMQMAMAHSLDTFYMHAELETQIKNCLFGKV